MTLDACPAPRALILAAGRGERMRPLTDHTPKPLLPVRGCPLMQWWVDALARGGVREIVVNTAWLGEQIESHFGPQRLLDGREQLSKNDWPAIRFSSEGRDFGRALETAGGIARALPQLAPGAQDVFWVLAGDIFAPDFQFDPAAAARFAASGRLAHLWLVPNPAHNPAGDFGIGADGLALNEAPAGSTTPAAGPPQGGWAPSGGSGPRAAGERGGSTTPAAGPPQGGWAPSGGSGPRAAGERGGMYTFSTVALYRRALFEPPWCDIAPGNPQGVAAPLAPLLRRAIAAGQVSAQIYAGAWTDVGTPERLAALQ